MLVDNQAPAVALVAPAPGSAVAPVVVVAVTAAVEFSLDRPILCVVKRSFRCLPKT